MNTSYMNVSHSSRMNTSMNTSVLNTSRRQGRNTEAFILSLKAEHCLEQFGEKLPSMIRSIVLNNTNQQRKRISCRLDANGWAGLVSGRKLYIWKHKYNSDVKRPAIACRELDLPPSELPHSAQLTCVVVNGCPQSMSNTPGCISVTPEGLITYWPNISNESTSVTINADIPGGQECDSLSSLWPVGCILLTTTGTVLLVKPTLDGGKKISLTCIPLNAQKGWLSGFGRKIMTTMIFNPISSSNFGEHKKSKVAIPISNEEPAFPGTSNSFVYVLNGPSLQTWKITSDKQLCIGEINIDDILRDHFHQRVPELRSQVRPDLKGIQIWILDIAVLQTEEIAVLAAALNQSETNESAKKFFFGIMTFSTKLSKSLSFTLVDYTKPLAERSEEILKNWELYCTKGHFYMISPELLFIIGENSMDRIELNTPEGCFLGSGLINDTTFLTFVPRYGIMVCRNNINEKLVDYTWADSRVPDHLALSLTQHNIEDLSLSEDNVNRYKSAFLSYLGKKNDECQVILNDLFPLENPSLAPNDPIDKWTVGLCEKLIDDAPLSDPRWFSTYRRDDDEVSKKKAKMLIKNFLSDKKEGIELFFLFLNSTGIRERLSSVVINENIIASVSILYNYYEKVGYAMALQGLQTESNYRPLIDGAIKSVVSARSQYDNQVRSAHLSANDIFFKDLSKVHQFIQALITIEVEYAGSHNSNDIVEYVLLVNEIILRTLEEMLSIHLDDKLEMVQEFLIQGILNSDENLLEIRPWILEESTFSSLLRQHEFVAEKVIGLADDMTKISEILRQLYSLTDTLLAGLKINLESTRRSDRFQEKKRYFEEIRSKLLKVFLTNKDYAGAGLLAEKYLDFEMLIKICYEEKEMERLEGYMSTYSAHNFADLTFEWFVKKKKGAELIQVFSSNPRVEPLLREFLKAYPQIAWHNSAVNNDFISSSNTLRDLSEAEKTYLDDKKFLMCLSKISFLATGCKDLTADDFSSNMYNYGRELALIEYQNQIKNEALEGFGMDRETMRVLPASDIIDLLTYPTNELEATDFAKALELCDYMVNEDIRKEKRLLIVARSIRRDPWDEWPTDHPEDMIRGSFLRQFLRLVVHKEDDFEDLLNLNDLFLVDILEELLVSDNAKFLLQASYEVLSAEFKAFFEDEGEAMSE